MEIDEEGYKETRTEEVIDNVKHVEKDLGITEDEYRESPLQNSLQVR